MKKEIRKEKEEEWIEGNTKRQSNFIRKWDLNAQ